LINIITMFIKTNVTLLIFLLLNLVVIGQNSLIDSLKNLLQTTNNELKKCQILAVLAEEADENEWPIFNDQLLKISKNIIRNNTSNQKKQFYTYYIKSLNNKGYYCSSTGGISTAKTLHYKALYLAIQTKDLSSTAESYNHLAYIFKDEGNIKIALDYYNKSRKIEEKLNKLEDLSYTLNNIGAIHYNLGDKLKAIDYFKKCRILQLKVKDSIGYANSLINTGVLFLDLNKYEMALKDFERSKEIMQRYDNKKGLAKIYIYFGNIFMKKKMWLKSKMYYQKSIDLNRKLNDNYELSLIYKNVASLYLDQNKIDSAKFYSLKSIELSSKSKKIDLLKENRLNLYKIYKKENRLDKALEMFEKFVILKDSFNNETNRKLALQSHIQYDYDKKQAIKEIEFRKNISLERKEKEKHRIILVFTFIGFILVFLFALFVYNRLKLSNSQKKEIENQKSIVDNKNREILDSITYAKRIQSAILPQPKLVKEYLDDSFVLYKPKDIVAGDFYWLEVVGDTVLFAAADCTGHGVPGAMVSVVCNNGLNRAVREYGLIEPNEILDKTRELVVEEFEKSDEEVKDGMDISLCALNTKTNTLKWAGANNPLWILRKGTSSASVPNKIIEFKADKQPIGKYANPTPFTLLEFQLEKNDIIYIFTDGFQDQFGGPKEKKFRVAQMKELFLTLTTKSMEEQRKIIDVSFEVWKGELEQVDDVCVIGVRI
jgi:serine phosphatase RsbU (regulator of sigma subunit)